MGCHTWFYKKIVPQPTYDEIKAYVINGLKKNAELYQQMIDGTLHEDIKEAYPEWNKEMGEKYLPIKLRELRMVEKDLCKKAQYNRYRGYGDDLTMFINNDIQPEIEISFQAEEEPMCMVYTDRSGN